MNELVPIPAVWSRLEEVERRLIEVTESGDSYLTRIARHLLAAGGKRYRPLLAQVAAELGPVQDERAVEAGVAVELIHVGSLYHDDVIDEADSRRGASSANEAWGNTLAILAGDFVLARASEVAGTSLGQEAVVLLARTYAELCQGQVLEYQLTDQLTHGPEDYFRVIENKTASLIRASARLGAMAADADDDTVEAVSIWGHEVGVAFQLIDDVLDLVASARALGKPAGADIGEGVFTLPVLETLRGPMGADLRQLLAGGHPYEQTTIDEVIDAVRRSGHIDSAVEEADSRIRIADKALAELPASQAREVMRSLGHYLLDQVTEAQTPA